MIRKIIDEIHNMTSKEVQEKIKSLRKEITELEDSLYYKNHTEEERKEILKKLTELDDRLCLYYFVPNSKMIAQNDDISLWKYRNDSGEDERYIIRKNDTLDQVGNIDFRDNRFEDNYLGSIGYPVYEEFRGHNYAFQALCLLSGYLHSNGHDLISINAYADNIPSVRTIQKFQEYLQGGEVTTIISWGGPKIVNAKFDLSLLEQRSL